MSWMMNLVVMVQIISALVMIGLVLVQHGKGADMGASFGSGASGSLFGATGSANFLSRSTALCAVVFFACTLMLAYLANEDMMRPSSGGGSVLDQPASTAPAASAPPATGAAQIPGAAAPLVPAAPTAPAAPAASVAAPTAAPAGSAPGQ